MCLLGGLLPLTKCIYIRSYCRKHYFSRNDFLWDEVGLERQKDTLLSMTILALVKVTLGIRTQEINTVCISGILQGLALTTSSSEAEQTMLWKQACIWIFHHKTQRSYCRQCRYNLNFMFSFTLNFVACTLEYLPSMEIYAWNIFPFSYVMALI